MSEQAIWQHIWRNVVMANPTEQGSVGCRAVGWCISASIGFSASHVHDLSICFCAASIRKIQTTQLTGSWFTMLP